MDRRVTLLLVAAVTLSVMVNLVFLIQYDRGGVRGGTFEVWNVPTTVKSREYLFSTMFDTFRMSVTLHSNSTIYVYVFTASQYAEFQSTGHPYSYVAKYEGVNVVFTWNLSTGCAGYVWIVYNPLPTTVEVRPDVKAIYDPSPTSTGVCASQSSSSA